MDSSARNVILKRLYKEIIGFKPAGLSEDAILGALIRRGPLGDGKSLVEIDAYLEAYNQRFLERTGASKMGRFVQVPLNKVLSVASKAPAPVLVDLKPPVAIKIDIPDT